jgi:predicted short-subunit dehydrogenase-like oxidoreductase (DUF2520 family)
LGSRFEYGVVGAGAVSASLIGRLPSGSREIGPVSAVSYRVASRIANTLRAGFPVRSADELNDVPAILFHSPPEQAESLLSVLDAAAIDWTGKALIFCDCSVPIAVRERFQLRGASVGVAREFGIPGRIVLEAGKLEAGKGRDAALQTVQRIARQLQLKAIEIPPASTDLFDAAVTLGSGALTALIDHTADLLRAAGIRDTEAARIASSFFEQTARDYAHSGKQSWTWYVRKPPVAQLHAQLKAAGPSLEPVMKQLLLFSFETFHKHADAATELTTPEV